jgi:hypothetical protein
MEIFKNRKYKIILMFICVGLIILIFNWIVFLTNNNYVVECFEDNYTHTVDMPLTTNYSCQNFCNPASRCAISGQQCFTDIDCPGCQPNTPAPKNNMISSINDTVPGADDAGKLTIGVTPQYSPLTTGYGTHERIITKNMFSKPSSPNFGVNIWLKEFNEERELYNKRYKPENLKYMPNYSERYTLTGEFMDDGPFPSNAPI